MAKSVFQLHGVDCDGKLVLRCQLRRSQMLEFFRDLSPCLVGMEACGSAHYWARELGEFGHDVRLMQPSYVKGYVKRGKTDKTDAEAICEAVSRPSMSYPSGDFCKKSAERAVCSCEIGRDSGSTGDPQGARIPGAPTDPTRKCDPRASTDRQAIAKQSAERLAEFGITIAKGIQNVGRVIEACESTKLPTVARKALNLLADQLVDTQKRIAELSTDIHADAKANEAAKRLQTIPGIGPITASAFVASLPDIADFKSGRDLSASC